MDQDDETSVDLRDAVLCGELTLIARVRVVDVYDRLHEIVLMPEGAEELQSALTAALDVPDAERQYRCGRPKRAGGPCGTPVARYGLSCGAHRDAAAVA